MKDFLISIIKFYNGNKIIQIISVFIPILIFSYIIYAFMISNPTDAKYLVDDNSKLSHAQIKDKLNNAKKEEAKQIQAKQEQAKQAKLKKQKKLYEKNNKNIKDLRKKRFDSDVQKKFDFEHTFQ